MTCFARKFAAGEGRHKFLCNILDRGSLVEVPLVEMNIDTWIVVLALLSIVAFLRAGLSVPLKKYRA